MEYTWRNIAMIAVVVVIVIVIVEQVKKFGFNPGGLLG
jgi:hypothetical protein